MSIRTSPMGIAARNVVRRMGLAPLLARVVNGRGYEDAFDRALQAAVRPGDVVWDVGANVGYYSIKFADWAAPEGRVFAFEPSPITLDRLRAQVGADQRITIVPCGLGAAPATMRMAQGEDDLGATSRVLTGAAGEGFEIAIDTGDRLLAGGEVTAPNVIKIDTEGFELDVLRGMAEVLRASGLRAVCVEVHFQLLEERGLSGAAREVERILAGAGFATRWVDTSHIVGMKG